MSTRYPLNGRYATLGDLILNFGKYSIWPKTTITDKVSGNTEDTSVPIPGWNSSTLGDQGLPFFHIVYNNKVNELNEPTARIPYSIVWFDNVYSSTKRSEDNTRMKIIQTADSDELNFDRQIYANDIYNYSKIKAGKYKFRFIVPNVSTKKTITQDDESGETNTITTNNYYFNYKTLDGEAVVMYALRNVIDLVKNNFKSFKSTYEIIGDSAESLLDLLFFKGYHEANIYTYTNEPISVKPYCPGIFDPSFNSSINDCSNDIFDFDSNYNINILNPDAYTYLGDSYWTCNYVAYENYMDEDSIVNIEEIATDTKKNYNYFTDSANIHRNNSDDYTLALSDASTLKVLLQNIFHSENESYETKLDENNKTVYDLTNPNDALKNLDHFRNKLMFYLYLFLNSLRFFLSYVTGFQFIKISSNTYTQTDPVLRCDVNVLEIIKSFTVISAEHLKSTALPPGQLSLDTTISIKIIYNIEYSNITTKNNNQTFTFDLTFQDFEDAKNATAEDETWYRLINPFADTIETYNNFIDCSQYSSDYFPDVIHYENSVKKGYSCSLEYIQWPLYYDETKGGGAFTTALILCESEDAWDVSCANPDAADTYNKETYNLDNNNTLNTFKEQYITNTLKNTDTNLAGPYGALRIHRTYDNSETNIINSSYYMDVSIYRQYNYFWVNTNSTDDNTETSISLQYLPFYNSNPINKYKISYLSQGINKQYVFNDNIYDLTNFTSTASYVVPSTNNTTIYLQVSKTSGEKYTYASGRTKLKNSSDEDEFINDLTPTLFYYDTNNSTWVEVTNSTIKSSDEDDLLTNQYCITLYNENSKFPNYWKFTLGTGEESTYKAYYFISPSDSASTLNSLSVNVLSVIDFDSLNSNIYMLSTANNSDGKVSNLSFLMLIYQSYDSTTAYRNLIYNSITPNNGFTYEYDPGITNITCEIMSYHNNAIGEYNRYFKCNYDPKYCLVFESCIMFKNTKLQETLKNLYIALDDIYVIKLYGIENGTTNNNITITLINVNGNTITLSTLNSFTIGTGTEQYYIFSTGTDSSNLYISKINELTTSTDYNITLTVYTSDGDLDDTDYESTAYTTSDLNNLSSLKLTKNAINAIYVTTKPLSKWSISANTYEITSTEDTVTLSSTEISSGNGITYKLSNNNNTYFTITGTVISLTDTGKTEANTNGLTGTLTVSATQSGNKDFVSAATPLSITYNIAKQETPSGGDESGGGSESSSESSSEGGESSEPITT